MRLNVYLVLKEIVDFVKQDLIREEKAEEISVNVRDCVYTYFLTPFIFINVLYNAKIFYKEEN